MISYQHQPPSPGAGLAHRFAAMYACAAVAASAAALALQVLGHFTGLVGAALVLIAMPAIVSVIAVGCSSAYAVAGVVQQAFFAYTVHREPAQRDMVAAK
jgi:hypothetical protein